MHIEPGIVNGAKMIVGVVTAMGSLGLMGRAALSYVANAGKLMALSARAIIATAMVFSFFQIFPHYSVGISEVHLILGSSLFLLFGVAPAAIGLSLGLLLQGLFFAPFDLPQYGMNITTLLVPLFAMAKIAEFVIPAGTAYKDLTYRQTLTLSLTYQAGIVSWVAFWAIYGQGVGMTNLVNIASFGAAYMSVVLIEPLVDLGLLASVKLFAGLRDAGLVQSRVYASR